MRTGNLDDMAEERAAVEFLRNEERSLIAWSAPRVSISTAEKKRHRAHAKAINVVLSALSNAERERDVAYEGQRRDARYRAEAERQAEQAETRATQAEAALKEAVGTLEALIKHFEGDGLHDVGAFDDTCEDCRILDGARDAVSALSRQDG